jgi:Exo-beta-D-glucosaminidase Ig-fold domain
MRNPINKPQTQLLLRVLKSLDGERILPSTWSGNHVSLLPGETRTLTARWRSDDAPGASPTIAVDGWNVEHK